MRSWRENAVDRGPKGLTILEVLIGVAVLAVLAVLIVPNANTAIHERTLKSTAEELVEDLNQARLEAASRGGISRLCPSSNGQTCRMNDDWHMGWVVFLDGNADGQVQEFELIDSMEITEPHIDIEVIGAINTAASFTLSGLSTPGKDEHRANENGEFRICYRGSSAQGRRIVIEPDGWVIDERLAASVCNPPEDGQLRKG